MKRTRPVWAVMVLVVAAVAACDGSGNGIDGEPGEDVDTRLFQFRHVPTDEAPLAIGAWQRVTVEARTLEDDTVGSFNVALAEVRSDRPEIIEVTGWANGQFIIRGRSVGRTTLTIETSEGLFERLDVESAAVDRVMDAIGVAPTSIRIAVGDTWVRALRLEDINGRVLAGNWTWQVTSGDESIATTRGYREDEATNFVEVTGVSPGTVDVQIGPGHTLRVEVTP